MLPNFGLHVRKDPCRFILCLFSLAPQSHWGTYCGPRCRSSRDHHTEADWHPPMDRTNKNILITTSQFSYEYCLVVRLRIPVSAPLRQKFAGLKTTARKGMQCGFSMTESFSTKIYWTTQP